MAYKPAYIWNGTGWDQIGNQAVANLDDYALLDPSASANQTITNTTLDAPYLISPSEQLSISASAASASVEFDTVDQAILYYSASATGNWGMNFRGDSSTTLNSIMSVGESITVSFLATQGSTAYYPETFTIDGSSVIPKWSGGSAPSGGNADSIDAYSFTIIKTGDAAFTVLAGAVQFA